MTHARETPLRRRCRIRPEIAYLGGVPLGIWSDRSILPGRGRHAAPLNYPCAVERFSSRQHTWGRCRRGGWTCTRLWVPIAPITVPAASISKSSSGCSPRHHDLGCGRLLDRGLVRPPRCCDPAAGHRGRADRDGDRWRQHHHPAGRDLHTPGNWSITIDTGGGAFGGTAVAGDRSRVMHAEGATIGAIGDHNT